MNHAQRVTSLGLLRRSIQNHQRSLYTEATSGKVIMGCSCGWKPNPGTDYEEHAASEMLGTLRWQGVLK